jgi:hypothetical protein
MLSCLSFLSFLGTVRECFACSSLLLRISAIYIIRDGCIMCSGKSSYACLFPFIYDTLHTEIADSDNLQKKILTGISWNVALYMQQTLELNVHHLNYQNYQWLCDPKLLFALKASMNIKFDTIAYIYVHESEHQPSKNLGEAVTLLTSYSVGLHFEFPSQHRLSIWCFSWLPSVLLTKFRLSTPK